MHFKYGVGCGVWLVVRRRRACNEWYVLRYVSLQST